MFAPSVPILYKRERDNTKASWPTNSTTLFH